MIKLDCEESTRTMICYHPYPYNIVQILKYYKHYEFLMIFRISSLTRNKICKSIKFISSVSYLGGFSLAWASPILRQMRHCSMKLSRKLGYKRT